MKISLIGYGKMGHAIEKIALDRGHEISCIIDAGEEDKYNSPEFLGSDVVIEFTTPATAVDNYKRVIAAGLPLVSGTTAWLSRKPEIDALLANSKEGMFWTSNFSIGVNLFFKIAEQAAKLIAPYPQYRPDLTEIHHIHKLDHPSGTAITTAEKMISASNLTSWTEDPTVAETDPTSLLINHVREGEVPGTHIVTWNSPVDEIIVEHRAFSREGFALGAVIAAEWMAANHPKGLSSMADLLGN